MDADAFLNQLPAELEPIAAIGRRYLTEEHAISRDAICISHRPRLGKHAFALNLYLPMSADKRALYQRVNRYVVPSHYGRFLESLNGAEIFELSPYGMPYSMAEDPPLLDRTRNQPKDIASANQDWRSEYQSDKDWCHFGAGPYSDSEHAGYFIDAGGVVYSIRRNGQRLGTWDSLRPFLVAELARCERLYPAYENWLAGLAAADDDDDPDNDEGPWWRKLFRV